LNARQFQRQAHRSRNVLREASTRRIPLSQQVPPLDYQKGELDVPVVDPSDPRSFGAIGWLARLMHGEIADKNPATELIHVAGKSVVLTRMSGEALEQWTRMRIAAADLGTQLQVFAESMDRESEEDVTEFKDSLAKVIAIGMVLCANATGWEIEEVGALKESDRRFIVDRQAGLNNDDAAAEFMDPYWRMVENAQRLPWPSKAG